MSNYSSLVLGDSPVRYYRLGDAHGGQVTDSSGNNYHGSAFSSGVTSGVADVFGANSAFSFNGTSGYITLPTNGLPTGNNPWTIECWFYATANNGTLVAFGTQSSAQGAILYIDNTGKLGAGQWDGGGGNDAISSTSISLNAWHHAVAVYDGAGSQLLYCDGALVASKTGIPARNLTLTSAHISAQPVSLAFFFSGSIDEVAIYGTALSATRVSAHYNALASGFSAYSAAVSTDAPLRYYHLDDTLGSTLVDSSSSAQNATLFGGGAGASGALLGDADTAFRFNGLTDYATIPVSGLPSGNASWAIEAWFNVNTLTGAYQNIANFGSEANGQTAGIAINNSNHVAVATWGSGNDINTTITPTTGAWHHLVGMWDGSTLWCYFDGKLAGSTSLSARSLNPANAKIGSRVLTITELFGGSIDEVAIYNHTLTSKQIYKHYLSGTKNFNSTAAQSVIDQYGLAILADNPIGYWPLDDASGDAKDASGNNNNLGYFTGGAAVIYQATAGPVAGQNCIQFANGNYFRGFLHRDYDYGAARVIAPYSVEVWYQSGNTGSGLITTRGPSDSGFDLQVVSATSVHSDIGTGSAWLSTAADSSAVPTGTTWIHLVYVVSRTSYTIYANGSQIATNSLSSSGDSALLVDRNHRIALGLGFTGFVAHVAVYEQALTATQVATHYKAASGTTTTTSTKIAAGRPRATAKAKARLSTYAQTILNDGPVYYSRQSSAPTGTIADSSGNGNTLTLGSGVFAGGGNGPFGDGAAFFRALGAATPTWTSRSSLTGPFSIEFWIDRTTTNGGICGSRTGSDQSFDITTGNDSLHADIGTGSAWLSTAANATFSASGRWMHAVYTFSATTWTAYVNGVQVGTGTYASSTPLCFDSTHNFAIGNTLPGGGSLVGHLDRFAVYASVLTSTQVTNHYAARTSGASYDSAVLTDTPVAYWKLGSNRAHTGISTGFPAGISGNVSSVAGLIADGDTALTFSGGRVWLPASAIPLQGRSFSLECWVKPTALASGQAMLCIGLPNGTQTAAWLWFTGTGGTNINFDTYNVSASSTFTGATTGSVYHVVGTYDGTTLKTYVNGAQYGSNTAASTAYTSFDQPIACIGGWTDGSNSFSGVIDEVAIYNYALSSTQVAKHYSLGSSSGTAYYIGAQLNGLASGSLSAHLLDSYLHISGVMSAVATGSMSAYTVLHVLYASGALTAVATGSASSRLVKHVRGILTAIASGTVGGSILYHLTLEALALAGGYFVPTLNTPFTPPPFTPSTIQDIADNIARTLLDLKALYLDNPQAVTPTAPTIIAGQTDPSVSFLTRLANLPDLQQKADLIPNALRSVEGVFEAVTIPQVAFYNLYNTFLAHMDVATAGLSGYLLANNIQVHPEFANAFNHVAHNAIALGVSYTPLTSIYPQSVFVPTKTFLGSYSVSSSTFVSTGPIDTTQYGESPITVSLPRTGNYTVTLTYTDYAGDVLQTVANIIATTIGDTQFGVSGTSVIDATVTGPTQAGDVYQFYAQPLRVPAY